MRRKTWPPPGLPVKPELPYPEGYCTDCKDHVRENDLFGFLHGRLFCTECYIYFRHIKKGTFIRKLGPAVEMGRGTIH